MPNYFIFPIYTSALAIVTFILIPRFHLRRLAVYGILLGAVIDVLAIQIVDLLKLGGYTNWGPFGFLTVPFFPPIAWTIFFVMYFYLLPDLKPWPYVFPFLSAAYSVLFSNVLINLGIFRWNYGRILIPFIIYFSWHTFATWAYFKLVAIQNQTRTSATFRLRNAQPVLLKRIPAKSKRRPKE